MMFCMNKQNHAILFTIHERYSECGRSHENVVHHFKTHYISSNYDVRFVKENSL